MSLNTLKYNQHSTTIKWSNIQEAMELRVQGSKEMKVQGGKELRAQGSKGLRVEGVKGLRSMRGKGLLGQEIGEVERAVSVEVRELGWD